MLNDVLAAIIRKSNGDVNEFVLSKASTLRGRKQARHSEFENIKEYFKNSTIGEFVTIHWDEKLLKQSRDVQQTLHVAVLSSNGNNSKLLGTTGLRRGTGLQQAEAIKELLDEWGLTDSCVAMCFDTTAANTGRFSGSNTRSISFVDSLPPTCLKLFCHKFSNLFSETLLVQVLSCFSK